MTHTHKAQGTRHKAQKEVPNSIYTYTIIKKPNQIELICYLQNLRFFSIAIFLFLVFLNTIRWICSGLVREWTVLQSQFRSRNHYYFYQFVSDRIFKFVTGKKNDDDDLSLFQWFDHNSLTFIRHVEHCTFQCNIKRSYF